MFDKIKAPNILTSPQLITNLQSITHLIIDQVYNLQLFMKDYHKNYQKFVKDLEKICQNFELKIKSIDYPINLAVMEFLKTVQNMAKVGQRQINKNLAYFKALKTQKSTQMFNKLTERFSIVKQLISNYEKNSLQLKKTEILYNQKASRFENIQNDTIKYYSTQYFKHKYTKITAIEQRLQISIQKLKGQQTELQLQFKEIKKLINELFEYQIKKIKEMLRYSRQIIEKIINLETVIAEQNSREEISLISQEYKYSQENFSNYTTQFLKKIKSNFYCASEIRDNFYYYLKNIIVLIEQTRHQLISLQKNDQFLKMQQAKKILEEYLGNKIYEEFVEGLNEVFKFCWMIQKLNTKLDRQKVLESIINIQKLNFQYFLKESIHALEIYKKTKKQIKTKFNNEQKYVKQNVQNKYREIQTYYSKFKSKDEAFTNNFQHEVMSIINEIKNLFKTYQGQYPLILKPTHPMNYQNQLSKIFTRKYFQIFIHPFIISQIQFKFQQSKFIQDYIKLNNLANNLENLTLDLNQLPQEHPRNSNNHPLKFKYKVGCCGITKINNQQVQNQVIQQYHCALINGFLLQGKIFLMRKQIRFISIFNNNTLVGRTQIQIPKRDIFKVEYESKFFQIIIIGTSHGQIKFTSFIHNPLSILKKLYLENKQVKNKIAHISYQKSNKTFETAPQYQIKQIKQKTLDILKKCQFIKVKNDIYSKLFPQKQIKCQLNLQQYPTALIVKVMYKSSQNPLELYSIKIIKKINGLQRIQCHIQDQNKPTTQLMKEQFLELAKKIVSPYESNNNTKEISKSILMKPYQSLILQISSIQSKIIQQEDELKKQSEIKEQLKSIIKEQQEKNIKQIEQIKLKKQKLYKQKQKYKKLYFLSIIVSLLILIFSIYH